MVGKQNTEHRKHRGKEEHKTETRRLKLIKNNTEALGKQPRTRTQTLCFML